MSQKKPSNKELTKIVENMFINNELMFLYYSGSKAYDTSSDLSDIDVTAVFRNLNGIIHASTRDIDIFAYGYDSFLARQSISDDLPLYNLIHADDIVKIERNLIYVNPIYKKDFESIIKIDFFNVMPLYLDAFIKYYDDLLNKEMAVVKRAYHVIRIRAVLEEVLRNKTCNIKLDDNWLDKIRNHKSNFKNLNSTEYLDELRGYLKEIIKLKEVYFKGDKDEV